MPERVRVPGLHRGALVRRGEGGEHGVAGGDLLQVALDDLGLVPDRVAAEVAAHRVDRLAAARGDELGGPAAVLLGERRPGQVDAPHGGVQYAAWQKSSSPSATQAREHYAGLETFPNPGVALVELTSDELVAMCPITNQPDMYVATIEYEPEQLCLESKSLKLYLARSATRARSARRWRCGSGTTSPQALELPAERVSVTLEQKARGGITIVAST